MIHSDTVQDIYSKHNIPLWLLSAFKAGYINSVGFLMTGKFVSHVTGFGTQVGIAMGHQEYFFGTELLVIPISFIAGGVFTSWILDQDYLPHETPQYWKVQVVITLLIGMVIFCGHLAGGSNFPQSFDADENYNTLELAIIGMLCLICGLKNSLVTWCTYGKIRVTHLTGLSTDIGLNLIRTFYSKQPAPRFKEDRFINIHRLLTLGFFSFGACLSAILYTHWGLSSLVLPMIISIFMSLVSIFDAHSRVKAVGRYIKN